MEVNVLIVDGKEFIVDATIEQIREAWLNVPTSDPAEPAAEKRSRDLVSFGSATFLRSKISGWRTLEPVGPHAIG